MTAPDDLLLAIELSVIRADLLLDRIDDLDRRLDHIEARLWRLDRLGALLDEARAAGSAR